MKKDTLTPEQVQKIRDEMRGEIYTSEECDKIHGSGVYCPFCGYKDIPTPPAVNFQHVKRDKKYVCNCTECGGSFVRSLGEEPDGVKEIKARWPGSNLIQLNIKHSTNHGNFAGGGSFYLVMQNDFAGRCYKVTGLDHHFGEIISFDLVKEDSGFNFHTMVDRLLAAYDKSFGNSIRSELCGVVIPGAQTEQAMHMASRVKKYLSKPYCRVLIPQDGGGFSAEILEFKGCFSEGETPAEAYANLEEVAAGWIESTLESGQCVPKPITDYDAKKRLRLNLPRTLAAQLVKVATFEGVSPEEFAILAIAEKVRYNAEEEP